MPIIMHAMKKTEGFPQNFQEFKVFLKAARM